MEPAATPHPVQILLQSLSLIILTAGLIYSGVQLRRLRKTHIENHDWNCRKASQDAFTIVMGLAEENRKLNDAFHYLQSADPISLEIFEAQCKTDPSLRLASHRRLDHFEWLAVGVGHGVFDESIIKDTFQTILTATLEQFMPYIRSFRRSRAEDAWIILEKTVARWKSSDSALTARERTST